MFWRLLLNCTDPKAPSGSGSGQVFPMFCNVSVEISRGVPEKHASDDLLREMLEMTPDLLLERFPNEVMKNIPPEHVINGGVSLNNTAWLIWS